MLSRRDANQKMICSFSLFNRVLRESTPRFVRSSVRRSACWPLSTFFHDSSFDFADPALMVSVHPFLASRVSGFVSRTNETTNKDILVEEENKTCKS